MTRFDAHRVFADAPKANDYIHNISLDEETLAQLRKARDAVRDVLRNAVPNWSTHVRKEVLFEQRVALGTLPAVNRPKFRMQGSMAYDTLNQPARVPPQETDVDDGMFLPVSFFLSGGRLSPAVTSQGLFTLVEAALEPLCRQKKWTLDRSKASCVRVIIGDAAHVDVALYAVPDKDFQVLVEAAKAYNTDTYVADFAESVELSEALYRRMPRDHVMLAHRTEDWKPSDPRKLEDWFTERVQKYGSQLRRVCRYLKAWRDEQWPSSRLSSISLMRCVVDSYASVGKDVPATRDDLALLRVAEQLPEMLSKRIANPVVDGQFLDEGWRPEDRADYVARARALLGHLRAALSAPGGAPELLRTLAVPFGKRLPQDVSLVRDESPTAGVVTSAALVGLSNRAGAREAVQKQGGGRYA